MIVTVPPKGRTALLGEPLSVSELIARTDEGTEDRARPGPHREPRRDSVVSIIDYGVGNLGSIRNMLKRIGVVARTVARPEDAAQASRIILPGVGAFDEAMRRLRERGFIDVLTAKALDEKVPVLGICLGMQLLCRGSEEGDEPGLGWIDAEVTRFRFPSDSKLKVPHMGWNAVAAQGTHPLLAGFDDDTAFYFVHSYRVPATCDATIATTDHGGAFAAIVARDNIVGAQFHPEKSHAFGMRFLRNFSELDAC